MAGIVKEIDRGDVVFCSTLLVVQAPIGINRLFAGNSLNNIGAAAGNCSGTGVLSKALLNTADDAVGIGEGKCVICYRIPHFGHAAA